MAGKGGGAWKVAYADFVTAMMAFFMVMWIVAQNKPVKEAIAGYFNDPSGKATRSGNGKSNGLLVTEAAPPPSPHGPMAKDTGKTAAPAKSTDDDGQGRGVARKPSLLGVHDGTNLTVEMLVPFDEESAELDDRGKQILDRIISELLGKMTKVEVRGHTSAKPLSHASPYHDAWELSYARSVAVMKYLTEKGVEGRRIRLSQNAYNEPASNSQNDGLLAPNGRVEVFVLSEMATDVREPGKERTNNKRPGKHPAKPKPAEEPME